MTTTLTRALADEDATLDLGAAIARQLVPGVSLHLIGPLGAGKTTLARGLLRALGERGRIRSPTFTLMEPYHAGGLDLVHLDLYRFEHADELVQSGFNEYLGGRTVTLIEWPERARGLLPVPDLAIVLDVEGEARRAHLSAHTDRGQALLAAIHSNGPGVLKPAPTDR